jgi:magnesium-transporting ATPase (P-type)
MELVMTDDTNRQQPETEPWHSLEPTAVEERFGGGEDGLGEDEVAERQERYGPNRLPAPPARGPLRRFLAQFNNLLIYVLVGAAVVTALLQHWIDTGVILAVVLLNSIIGFIQEGKAEKALEAIREMLSPHASVIRGGERLTIPAEELVPGDRVLLEAGDKVPADMRLLRAKGLQVQESALTGESVPVEKRVDAVDEDTDLGDRFSMAYSGTLVTSGRGTGIVVAIGADTQIGRISTMLSEVETLTTPLLKAMNVFARWLTLAIVGFATLVFFFAFVLRDFGAVDSFMASVALAVAAIPEGLPAILTVTLAIGVQRMAGRNAIIRRLPAVETLGSVSIICSDKTGTLTRNEMTVRSIALHQRDYAVSGVGYEPRGSFERDGREVDSDDDALLTEALRAMVLCNDATLREDGGEWVVDGDPMEGALLTAGRKGDLDPSFEHQSWTRTDVIPFESEHQFMATLNHDHEGHGRIYLKGAPERLLEMCASVRTEDGSAPLDRDAWMRRVDELAAQGERVLAVAFRSADSGKTELRFDDVDDDLTLLGLFGLIDPPREEAIRAVAECQSAGIRVKMITGDHAGTAQAIGKQLGLERADEVLTGRDLQAMDDEELKRRVVDVDLFARTTPEHKLRLVRALQAHGYVVAMTGDGVNDAPALKQADVGVAMGQNGTETSKEASEMVLADDNFASIANAVREGRTVYDNLKKAITFLLPINGGESGSIIAAIMLGLALPITPLQVLWVNMVSSVGLAMALAFEPAEKDIMQRPPRPPGEPILSAFVIWRIVFVSILFLVGIFGMYTWSVAQGFSIEMARTHAVNTLVVMEVFYLFSVRSLRTRALTLTGIIGTRAVAVAVLVVVSLQLIFTYAPFMQFFFDSRPMGLREAAIILGVGIAVFALLEVEKAVRNRYAAYRHPERTAH